MSSLRRGLRSPPPAPTPERCVHTQTAGRGRRRLTPRGEDAPGAASHPLPLHTSLPSLLTPAPLPQPENSRKPVNAAQMRGSDLRLSFNCNGETYPTQTRARRDAASRGTQAGARGPGGAQTSAASDRATAPCPLSPTTDVPDSHLLVVLKNPSRSPPRRRSGH